MRNWITMFAMVGVVLAIGIATVDVESKLVRSAAFVALAAWGARLVWWASKWGRNPKGVDPLDQMCRQTLDRLEAEQE
jgi:hypothetical protein